MKYLYISFLLASATDAFTVAPPPPPTALYIDTPGAVTSLQQQQQQQQSALSPSNLPSQQDLLLRSASISSSSSLISTAAATAPVTAAPVTAAPPTKENLATSGVAITGINYNGKVPTTEADEYVVVTNVNKQPVDMSGYYIYVATTGTQGPTFYFPKESIVKPNQSVRIYTNELHPETGGYTFKSGKAIWNNKGGLAVMKDANGKKVCEFKYKGDA